MPFDGTSTYSEVFRAYAIDPNPPQRREAQAAPYVPFEGTSAYKVGADLCVLGPGNVMRSVAAPAPRSKPASQLSSAAIIPVVVIASRVTCISTHWLLFSYG